MFYYTRKLMLGGSRRYLKVAFFLFPSLAFQNAGGERGKGEARHLSVHRNLPISTLLHILTRISPAPEEKKDGKARFILHWWVLTKREMKWECYLHLYEEDETGGMLMYHPYGIELSQPQLS